MSYAYARFRSDPRSKAIYRAVPHGYFETLPRLYRWFWRAARLMPDWLFRRSFTSHTARLARDYAWENFGRLAARALRLLVTDYFAGPVTRQAEIETRNRGLGPMLSNLWPHPASRVHVSGRGMRNMSQKRQLLRNLEAKWNFLSSQRAFHLAPVRTTLRLASWRIRCLLERLNEFGGRPSNGGNEHPYPPSRKSTIAAFFNRHLIRQEARRRVVPHWSQVKRSLGAKEVPFSPQDSGSNVFSLRHVSHTSSRYMDS